MVNYMGIELGNIYFLAAHSSPRFNAETNDIFWHKNEVHNIIIENFTGVPPEGLDELIHKSSMYAKEVISEFVEKNGIDLLIAHNTPHPYNFITAVGLGYYIEELRSKGICWPKVMVWWHDSYFERERFKNPNNVIRKYLKYLPGTYIDGIAFINKTQLELAKKYFKEFKMKNYDRFFNEHTIVVPNTSSIDWDWEDRDWEGDKPVYPKPDNYNQNFLKDIGINKKLVNRGLTMKQSVFLLQHTRIVPRKKIEVAIDFAFRLEKKFREEKKEKAIIVLVSGHSGDEQVQYKRSLKLYYNEKMSQIPDSRVILIFGEKSILSHRDIIVDKKYYNFYEVPSIISSLGGLGTYFSEIEGFGNNLLEMISFGLPVVINKYPVFKTDIEHLEFKLPAIENDELDDEIVNEGYKLLTDIKYRNQTVKHNLEILKNKLDHKIIADLMRPLIVKMFTQILNTNIIS
jgi:hypothetical protein